MTVSRQCFKGAFPHYNMLENMQLQYTQFERCSILEGIKTKHVLIPKQICNTQFMKENIITKNYSFHPLVRRHKNRIFFGHVYVKGRCQISYCPLNSSVSRWVRQSNQHSCNEMYLFMDNLSLCDHLSYNNPCKKFQVRMGPVPKDTVLQIRLLKEVAWQPGGLARNHIPISSNSHTLY